MADDDRAAANAYRRAWYARQKEGNTPAYRRLIARQRQYAATHKTQKRLWWARHREHNTRTYQNTLEHCRARTAGMTLAQYQARPRVQLGCCGVFLPVTTLPHVCPTCGSTYLTPTEEPCSC